MHHTLPPSDATRLRVQHRTMREYCIERNYIDAEDTPSRRAIRNAINDMDHEEGRVLRSRLRDRMETLTELMDGDGKSFDEPHIEHKDLAPEVCIPDFDK